MPYELFGRICVGAPLAAHVVAGVHADFLASLGAAPDATADDIFTLLRADTPKHKLHEPDRVRYERALEAFIDARWDVDFAIGGVSPDGLLDTRRGYLFVGVRIEQFEMMIPEIPRHGAAPERPQWLTKGDLSRGSDLSKLLGPDVRKQFEHACTAYSRAAKEILKDALTRLRVVPISKAHEPTWALCRWIVDAEHPSAQHRHGRHR